MIAQKKYEELMALVSKSKAIVHQKLNADSHTGIWKIIAEQLDRIEEKVESLEIPSRSLLAEINYNALLAEQVNISVHVQELDPLFKLYESFRGLKRPSLSVDEAVKIYNSAMGISC